MMNRGTATADDVVVFVRPIYFDPKALRVISDMWQSKGFTETGLGQVCVITAKKPIHPYLPIDEFIFSTGPLTGWEIGTTKIAFHLDIYARNHSVTKIGVEFVGESALFGKVNEIPLKARIEP
jgi:hypothetical protein